MLGVPLRIPSNHGLFRWLLRVGAMPVVCFFLVPVIAPWNGKIVWRFAELQPVDYKENLCVLLDKILFVCRDSGIDPGTFRSSV